jgi:transcriptional regulator with GAF, ATPase, and Fis domain
MLRCEGAPAAVDAALGRIAAAVRPMDAVADYGPDEVAVVAPELDELDAFAARLVTAARGPVGAAPVGVRIGVAQFPRHGADPGELVSSARAALRAARLGGRDAPVVAAPEERAAGDVVVVDPQMKRVYELVERVAASPMTVLIQGETGAGKEVVAEALHRRSERRGRPFVRINCACLPENLLESELFGHERGAFTGADKRKAGYFEAADGGTIFLDEIGEISPGLQAKLLRVLQERRFSRVGGTQEVEVDVRVVCATNRDLEAEVARGAFREDLYFRISAFAILIPPLRDRRAEIIPLTERFLRELGPEGIALGPEARAALERYPWPGNVRELRNAIERAVVLQSGGTIALEDLPERIARTAEADVGGGFAPVLPAGDVRGQIAEVERATIAAALAAAGGNQTRAAQRLGLTRRALIYRMEKHGLKPPPGGA